MRSLRASAMAPGTDAVIRQLAEMHVESNSTIEELAFLCNMSLSTFKRKFSSIYNMAPSKWFLQQRMERAAALLRMGNEKPSDVYYKVGYESHSSFTHSFKQVFGVTPSEYQQAATA
jgi:AraC-like DNA-binding protein